MKIEIRGSYQYKQTIQRLERTGHKIISKGPLAEPHDGYTHFVEYEKLN